MLAEIKVEERKSDGGTLSEAEHEKLLQLFERFLQATLQLQSSMRSPGRDSFEMDSPHSLAPGGVPGSISPVQSFTSPMVTPLRDSREEDALRRLTFTVLSSYAAKEEAFRNGEGTPRHT